ncbi:BnaC02g23000D [Brassica napus]|uniref:(rape) hypothetical protein n=1 Tax=Brassica napus TaxID=3708 RepID=A0A078HMU5_BRANA|nr:unnamed protein product [Brassica napus]CDY38679.1 BnaC02g23000D [Brassica napus]
MMDLQSLDVEPITANILPFWPQTSRIKTSTTGSWFCNPSLESELKDAVGFLKSLGNYEKSGVPKGAATDSGDAFISIYDHCNEVDKDPRHALQENDEACNEKDGGDSRNHSTYRTTTKSARNTQLSPKKKKRDEMPSPVTARNTDNRRDGN